MTSAFVRDLRGFAPLQLRSFLSTLHGSSQRPLRLNLVSRNTPGPTFRGFRNVGFHETSASPIPDRQITRPPVRLCAPCGESFSLPSSPACSLGPLRGKAGWPHVSLFSKR